VEIDSIYEIDRSIIDKTLPLLEQWPDLPVIIDLSGSTFLNTLRLGIILELQHAAGRKNRIRLVVAEQSCLDVLRRCALVPFFPVFDSHEKAMLG